MLGKTDYLVDIIVDVILCQIRKTDGNLKFYVLCSLGIQSVTKSLVQIGQKWRLQVEIGDGKFD